MEHGLYEVFKDDFDPRQPWRVQFPRGRMAFHTKSEAVEAAAKFKAMDEGTRWFDVYYANEPTFTTPDSAAVESLSRTHTFVLRHPVDNKNDLSVESLLEKVFHHMQGEIWSPDGEARSLVYALGIRHTSMSVGDVVRDLKTGQLWGVASMGFIKLG